MSIKYSIIVPAYNVEKYIEECLNSISNQQFDDYECLIIDDGSTDKTSMIAAKFCGKNDKFHYIKKENGGLSNTRNLGLSLAKGKYIVFVDSDDLISKHFFLSIENTLSNYPETDLILINFEKFQGDIQNKDNNKIIENKILSSKQLICYPSFSWLRIVKRSLYEPNIFPEGYIYEDVVVSTLLSYKAEKIVENKAKLYFYRKRENSITTSSPEKQFMLFDSMKILKKCCAEKNIPEIYYKTTFVNMTQSIVMSLVRIESTKVFFEKLKYSLSEYESIDLVSGLLCYSKIKFKLLFICIKLKWLGLPFYYIFKIVLKILNKL